MTINITSASSRIKQYDTDPSNLKAELAWILRQGTGGGIFQSTTSGSPMGLLLSLTYPYTLTTTGISYTYQFSYRTKEGTTNRVTIS